MDLDKIFIAIQADLYTDEGVYCDAPDLWLGPPLTKMLMERQRDFIQSPFAFSQALKVCSLRKRFTILAKNLSVRIHDPFLFESIESRSWLWHVTTIMAARAL